jgi:hypothetical protein
MIEPRLHEDDRMEAELRELLDKHSTAEPLYAAHEPADPVWRFPDPRTAW